ncbi:ToxD-like protein [Fusarium denticulatum]|uniref:ToxD-like protein n=1 Tax=Fusarium denticulatum TaxID=48507 RepID=A0A8H5SVK5_9HYPO|nr:ToxD-like protein [Fusarium denticulatum]
MKALVLNTSLKKATVEDVDRPSPSSHEILVNVRAIALNPVDELYVSSPIAAQEKRIIGTDFAGVVVEAGSEISGLSDPRVKIGTRVAGFLQGASSVNDRPGAFAEFIVVPNDLVWKIPDNVTFEEASAISMCGLTAAQALFGRLGLPSPFSLTPQTTPPGDNKITNLLIYGSSTSVGLYAAQLARIAARVSGMPIRLIGAASSSKHEMLRNEPYSYDVLVDYRDEEWVQKVKDATDRNGIDLALDCISERQTVYNTHETLAPSAKLAVIRGPVGGMYDPALLTVKPAYGAVWEGLGVEVGYNDAVIPANPDAHAYAKDFYKFLSKPLPSGSAQVEPNPVRMMPGGFERVVQDGFSILGTGLISERSKIERTEEYVRPISGEKLVYSVSF